MKKVALEDYELSPNVRRVCFVFMMFFIVVTGASFFGLNVPEKIKDLALLTVLPAAVLLNAQHLSIWVRSNK